MTRRHGRTGFKCVDLCEKKVARMNLPVQVQTGRQFMFYFIITAGLYLSVIIQGSLLDLFAGFSYHPMIILAERCLFLSFCCHCSWSRFSALTLHHNPPPTATNVKAMAPLGDLPLEAEYRAPSQWSIIIDRINTSVFYQKVSAFLITCGVFPDWNGSFYESKKFRDWRKRREYERQQSEEVVSQWATVVLGKY